ncbi:hypothetical protein [Flexithrix dorotheae]|uniref:hypothetical protein n=1 Tax=Flexithrix dorotheae TaxID=70993 RepID=UPI0003618CB0|nr:hypothetical protein [Flexithrix dorotheae]
MKRIFFKLLAVFFIASCNTSPGDQNKNAILIENEEFKDFPSKLFEGNTIFPVTLKFDIDSVSKDIQMERSDHPVTLIYEKEGKTISLNGEIKTRGNFRSSEYICNFPPFSLKFPKSEEDSTLFEGTKKLKVVTHCINENSENPQYLFQEYLVYKIYEQLTPKSFKVQLLQVKYEDTSGDIPDFTSYAFLIENDEKMAIRNESVLSEEIFMEGDENPDYNHSTLLSTFQFMIGNTDWFLPDHNMKVMVDQSGDTTAIPYDFDLSGMVNAPYANQYHNFGMKSIRDRKFMGFCRNESEYKAVFNLFNDKKNSILALYRSFPYLDEAQKKASLDYIESFYTIINSPDSVAKYIEANCSSTF